jgi:hypothetical protein
VSYERTVAGALSERDGKFRLAEGLALDIPPMRGRDSDTRRRLEEAREAIIAAGGEPKSVETLADYRRTGQWAILPSGGEFRWLPGVTFTAHRRAAEAGMSFEDFAALPVKTGDAVNAALGKPPIRGLSAMSSWTPEQRAAALRELVADEELAEEVGVLRDGDLDVIGENAADVRLALMGMPHSERAEVIRDALADPDTADAVVSEEETRRSLVAAEQKRSEGVLKSAGFPEGKLELSPQDKFARWSLTELDMDLLLMARKLKAMAKALSSRTAPIPPEYQEDMLSCIQEMRTSLDFAESAISRETADWDEALSELGEV